jgi:hypothetical protein
MTCPTTGASPALRSAVIAALASVALSVVAGAASAAVSEKLKNACRDDYHRFCPGYPYETEKTPELDSCMKTAGLKRQLSPRCLQALIDAGKVPRRYLTKK